MARDTGTASAVIAALAELGNAPLIPGGEDTGAPAPIITPLVPPSLVRTNLAPPPAPTGAVVYNGLPWRGPVGLTPLDGDAFYLTARHVLAETIGIYLGLPPAAALVVIDTLPADYLPLLDDWAGWWVIAEAVADRLGLNDPDNSVLPNWIH